MKTCKTCNKPIQDSWTYCNDKMCERLRQRTMYLKLKSEGKIPHRVYTHSDVEVKNWICNCKQGFIIPLSFTKCVKCKGRQHKGWKQPRYHKLFNPNIHAVTLAHFFESKKKDSIKAVESVS